MEPIIITHDFTLDLATAPSRLSKRWVTESWLWSRLVKRCSQTRRTDETVGEYRRMSRDEQSRLKDVGGFVGGYLKGGVRKTEAVVHRSCVTLDLDYARLGVWDDLTLNYGCAALIYSTRKHTSEAPRLRLVLPASRPMTPREYEPVARYWTSRLGIEMFDHTTYQLARLFYWPSTSRDGEWVFEYQDGAPFDVDEVLATYRDPFDATQWPLSSREGEAMVHDMKRRAGNPHEKPGLIGAFCRAYTVEEVVEGMLSEVYEPTATEGRYTYRAGHVAGGLVTYEGLWAYSHHETDPAGGQLLTAFDLARVHLYGARDEGKRGDDVTRLPSHQAMLDHAAKDPKVCALMARERLAQAADDFAGVDDTDTPDSEGAMESEPDMLWLEKLTRDRNGAVHTTITNIMTILEHDPKLAGHLWHDLFSGFDYVVGGLPWRPEAKQWEDRDDALLRVYLDSHYGISGRDKVRDALAAVLMRHRRHPLREYLEGLTWDGTERLDRLVIDYVGAVDSPLNRAMTRKHFTAAVARVMRPGCKYDYCLLLAGPEGTGKSTLFATMGGEWFNDSLITTEGKAGMEQIRATWIAEMAELSSMKRSDVEQVKNYLSRRDDIYRAAYASVVEKHPRQCVFCGTTNETHFLKGDTGNRRFWVIAVDPALRREANFVDALKRDRDQLWAEAVHRFRKGEKLYLDATLEAEARARQGEYNDNADDPMMDMLMAYLDMPLPTEWEMWPTQRRRAYIVNPDPMEPTGTVRRDRVCAAEFICERLGVDLAAKEYKYTARKVNNLLGQLGWEGPVSMRHVEKLYGRQRGFRRPVNPDLTPDEDL